MRGLLGRLNRSNLDYWGGRRLRRHELWGLQLSCSTLLSRSALRVANVLHELFVHFTAQMIRWPATYDRCLRRSLRKTLRQKRQRTKYGGEISQDAPLQNALNRRCNHSLRELPAPVRRLFLLFGVVLSAVTRVNNLEVVRRKFFTAFSGGKFFKEGPDRPEQIA